MRQSFFVFPLLLIFLTTITLSIQAQEFIRTELPTTVNFPWEITYGPDDFLWMTETEGVVSRVDPISGAKTVVYQASDYFGGSVLETWPNCHQPLIGAGTLGLALHPDFSNPETAYIFYVYSYNNGTTEEPETKFRIKRLKWDATTASIIEEENIVNNINNSYDHLGGRLIAVKQNKQAYLFLSLGDNGLSEDNAPDCYESQTDNPNNFTQDINTQQGKIHRFNIDGSIPADNPVAGNSFYTRGHRNPQGLMYNSELEMLYDVEHGDRTDDEINILYKGMNYGWKQVRGYHDDNNHSGESDFIANYTPHPSIPNDALIAPLYAWCAVTANSSGNNGEWCTVAPCDGVYYGSDAIPEWTNSLLVATLKDGTSTDMEVYQFKLKEDGHLMPATVDQPNPQRFFGEDQGLNGRLRDIAVSIDGKNIYLINNGGAASNKITVYTYKDESSGVDIGDALQAIKVYPNPANDVLTIQGIVNLPTAEQMKITNVEGQVTNVYDELSKQLDISDLPNGVYFLHLNYKEGVAVIKFVKL